MNIEEVKIRCNNLFNLIEEVNVGIINFLEKQHNIAYLSTLYDKFCFGSGISKFTFEMLFIRPLINQGKVKEEQVYDYHYLYNNEYNIRLIKNIGSDSI